MYMYERDASPEPMHFVVKYAGHPRSYLGAVFGMTERATVANCALPPLEPGARRALAQGMFVATRQGWQFDECPLNCFYGHSCSRAAIISHSWSLN